MLKIERKPFLFVVSAPSGAGKTTLCDRLVREFADVVYSVSCTTRRPREGEIDGVSYTFLPAAEFEARATAGAFLEHALVHDNHYGTLKETIRTTLQSGRDVLMDIDVQGAQQIRQYVRSGADHAWLRDKYVDIFIAPPSMQDLQLRLWGRGSDEKEVIERRLARAQSELEHWDRYQYVIVNDRLDDSYEALRSILLAERHRIRNVTPTPPSTGNTP